MVLIPGIVPGLEDGIGTWISQLHSNAIDDVDVPSELA